MVKEKLKPGESHQDQLSGGNDLLLFNDDVNTFDFVIETLIELCDHEPLQAEQCALVTHLKGKCAVKSGTYKELEPICIAMHDRGLSAEIQ